MLTETVKLPVGVRWLVRADLPIALNIQTTCRVASEVWAEKEWLEWARQKGCCHRVLVTPDQAFKDGERMLGYLLYRLESPDSHRPNETAAIELVDIGVAPAYRRHGVGTKAICSLLEKCGPNRSRKRLWAVVRERNSDGLAFLKAFHPTTAKIVRKRYQDPDEDGIELVFADGNRHLARCTVPDEEEQ